LSRRSFWGWGEESGALDEAQRERLGALVAARLGTAPPRPLAPPLLEALRLPAPRVVPPAALGSVVTTDLRERASHAHGKAFRDVARALAGDFSHAPDAVALPRDEDELAAVLEWCAGRALAVIPYGGGSSVVGGVEPRVGPRWNGAVTLDLRRLDAIREVDRTSRAARIQAGIHGPALEAGLRAHGLTLRHFPQSFEFSTLGGWIATRAGGHYATLHTHVDDFVESLRVVTPAGVVQTRRLPSSGAGPSPDRLFIGSEGALGVVTEAWMRLQDRPRFRAAATVRFRSFLEGAEAVRHLAQSGLHPAGCRLLDAEEALQGGVGDGTAHPLLLAFESADHGLDAWMDRALALCADAGGTFRAGAGRTRETDDRERGGEGGAAVVGPGGGERDPEAASWRAQFFQAPYLRDALAVLGYVVETFETAVTWDRFPELHRGVTATVEEALRRICGGGRVTCRLTHVYPDGAAPYFTVLAPGRSGAQLEQWDEIKAAASEAILALGGTITHHHAVGRDHRPWYDRERPAPFAAALRAAKAVLDPAGIMNPGVLID
jgi:alkyldihydroxyacetonephosphate synthase